MKICRHCGKPLYMCNHEYFMSPPLSAAQVTCPDCGIEIYAEDDSERYCPGCGRKYTTPELRVLRTYPKPAKKRCPNSYHWSLAGRKRWEMYYRPVLRQPAPGEPDVPDLAHTGDWIVSRDPIKGYRYGEGLVVSITKHVGLPGLECVYYTICYIPDYKLRRDERPATESDAFGWSSDVAAQGGRLVGLFEADTAEYVVSRLPDGLKIPVWAHRILDAQRQLRLF